MSMDPFARLLSCARRRRAAIVLALALPWLVVAVVVAWQRHGAPAAGLSGAAVALAIAACAWWATRLIDHTWLQRLLDARHPGLEDSSALLFADGASLSPLARLQRERVQQRLPSPEAADVRAPWPQAWIAGSALVAAAVMLAGLLGPSTLSPTPASEPAPKPPATATRPSAPELVEHTLDIKPPAYTDLPTRSGNALDARVPEGSELAWRLRFAPQPDAVVLEFVDGRRVELRHEDSTWQAKATATTSGLYRIVATPALPPADGDLHRIDVVPDRPPSIRVTAPAQNLSLRTPGQRRWTLEFEAEDDHGIDAAATMQLTMTEGSGENIGFREEARSLRGSGSRRLKRFTHPLDLDALGLSEGDDLIVHFTVRDNRARGAQTTRSASYILRWPPPEARADSGFDGVLQRVLPAYFSSQRQIIIDAEALLAEQSRLDTEAFAARSDTIAVDQRLLRLRYGQFLGEESEGAASLPTVAGAAAEDLPPPPVLMPTNDAEDEAEAWRDMVAAQQTGSDNTRSAGGGDGHRHDADPGIGHSADDGHDHGEGTASGRESDRSGFGIAGDVLEAFGHTHDIPEAATLLDPKTRNLLRRALGEMWQSELALRQARPRDALPPANRALALVKEIQQADRIHLARTGTALPPVDFSRRLGGEREGIGSRRDGLAPAHAGEDAPAMLWRAMAPMADAPSSDVAGHDAHGRLTTGADATPELRTLQAWLSANEARVDDPLSLLAAIDAVTRDPACDDCRTRLRALLWPLATPPPAAPPPRTAADAVGNAYLDALRMEPGE